MEEIFKIAYAIMVTLLASDYNNYNLIEKIYVFLTFSIVLVFSNNSKIVLTEHLIYSFVLCTFSLCCNNKAHMFTGLISAFFFFLFATRCKNMLYIGTSVQKRKNDRNV